MKHRDIHSGLKNHIITLRVILVVMAGFCFMFWLSAEDAKKTQRFYTPPDLRYGATTEINEIPPSTAYAFALNIFQVLNVWKEDGRTDYAANIFKLGAYLTPTYRDFLNTDVRHKTARSELFDRTRIITPINGAAYKDDYVQIIDKNNWIVWLDMNIVEFSHGIEVKNVDIRYPINVTRTDLPPDINPWALQLNGYAKNPTLIKNEK